jgi:hypothetical protein
MIVKLLRKIFRSRAMSKAVKTEIYKIVVKLIAMLGSETQAMAESDMK